MAKEDIEIRLYTIVGIDDMREAMEGLSRRPTAKRRQSAKVREICVPHSRRGMHGGRWRNTCEVPARAPGAGRARCWEGKLATLKRFKDDAREVAQGYECGIALEL